MIKINYWNQLYFEIINENKIKLKCIITTYIKNNLLQLGIEYLSTKVE